MAVREKLTIVLEFSLQAAQLDAAGYSPVG